MLLQEMIRLLVEMGIAEDASVGYAAALVSEGFDTPAAFEELTTAELTEDFKFKRGHLRMVQRYREDLHLRGLGRRSPVQTLAKITEENWGDMSEMGSTGRFTAHEDTGQKRDATAAAHTMVQPDLGAGGAQVRATDPEAVLGAEPEPEQPPPPPPQPPPLRSLQSEPRPEPQVSKCRFRPLEPQHEPEPEPKSERSAAESELGLHGSELELDGGTGSTAGEADDDAGLLAVARPGDFAEWAKQSTAEDVFDELLVEVLPFMFTSAVCEAALMLGRAHMAKARAALTGPQFVADQIMNGYVEQEVRFAVQDAINEQISEYFTSRAADAIVAEVRGHIIGHARNNM